MNFMETKKEKAVIYARVSSREQEETGYSLPEQERFLKEYSEGKFEVVEVFSISESASGTTQRKIFSKMMKYLEENGINNIVVETTDRLTRNFKDVPEIDNWVIGNEHRKIHLVKEGCVLHRDSKSHEWFMWRVKVATAEYYIRLLSENVKKGQKGKIADGWLPTKPPAGYKTIGEKGHKIHIIDEDVSPLVIKMFRLYATGNYSTKALAEKMYDLGLRNSNGNKIVKSRIHELLKDPFYYGEFVWKGAIYKGKHKPLITKRVFEQVQEKISRGQSSPYHTKHLKVLQGKVKCGECRCAVTFEKQKGTIYGGCKNCKAQLDTKKKYIWQDKLEDQLISQITSIAPKNEEVLKVLEKALKESHSEEIACYEAQKTSLENQLTRIKQRMNTLYDDRLDGRITPELFDEKYPAFKKQAEDIQQAVNELETNNNAYYQAGFAIHELATNAEKIYRSKNATRDHKRLFLSYALSSASVLKGKTDLEYTPSFAFLAEWMPKVNKSFELAKNTENNPVIKGEVHNFVSKTNKIKKSQKINSRTEEYGSNKRQKDTFVSSHPTMLRRQDSNLQPSR